MSLNEELTKNAAAKSVMSRIALKIDTWENWQKEDAQKLVLHAGEVAFVQVGSIPPIPKDQTTHGILTDNVHLNIDPNSILFKVGDGVSEFKDLVWGSAKAADVYGWAKQNETEFKNWLSGETKVGGDGEDKDDPVIGDPFVLKSVFNAAVTGINNSITALTEATTDETKTTSLASRLAVVEGLAGIGDEGTTGSLATVEYVDKTKEDLIGTDTTVDTIKYAIKQASEAGTAANNAQTTATSAEGKVDTLIGTDTGKSARTIANEELAAQLLTGKADADFKTLQSLATWLEDHPEDAAELNRLLSGLGTTGEGDNAPAKTVKEYVDEAVGAEETARSTAITNAIKALDVDVVAVGAGKTLASIKQEDGKIVATPVDIAITKSQITDFNDDDYADAGHNHDDKYANKTTTEEHIANGDIHVTKAQKDSWTTGATKAETAVQSVTFNGTEIKNGTTVALTADIGDANGQVKINGTNIAVKGLGSAAFTESTAYASSTDYTEHKAKAITTETYLLIDCGTSTINVD